MDKYDAIFVLCITIICIILGLFVYILSRKYHKYDNSLCNCIFEKKFKKLKKLLENGSDPNEIEYDLKDDIMTSVFVAAQEGDSESLKLLLEHKGNTEIVSTRDRVSPLYIACQNGHNDCVKLLIDAKANFERRSRKVDGSAIFIAIQYKHNDCIETLIDAKANVNASLYNGVTPLHNALAFTNIDIIKSLMNAKADMYKVDNELQISPIFMAVTDDRLDALKLFIERGADIFKEKFTKYMYSPLQIANMNGSKKCADYLQDIVNERRDKVINEAIDESCPICLEKIEESDRKNIKVTECFHCFHQRCWDEYREHDAPYIWSKVNCAVCRTKTM